ncbi:MAG: kelch repeat-containing protein [bacterium]
MLIHGGIGEKGKILADFWVFDM